MACDLVWADMPRSAHGYAGACRDATVRTLSASSAISRHPPQSAWSLAAVHARPAIGEPLGSYHTIRIAGRFSADLANPWRELGRTAGQARRQTYLNARRLVNMADDDLGGGRQGAEPPGCQLWRVVVCADRYHGEVGLKSIEICAGAGGQALGLEQAGFAHVALVENYAACVQTLRAIKQWRDVVLPISVKHFYAREFRGTIDLLAGGVPCPPFSRACRQLGGEDERDLFPTAIRLIEECRPRAVLLENVRGLLHPRFDRYRKKWSQSPSKTPGTFRSAGGSWKRGTLGYHSCDPGPSSSPFSLMTRQASRGQTRGSE